MGEYNNACPLRLHMSHHFVERPIFYLKAIEIILLFTSFGCIFAVEDFTNSNGAISALFFNILGIIFEIGLLVLLVCEDWINFKRFPFMRVNKWASLLLAISILVSTQLFSSDFACGTVNCITAQVACTFLNVNSVILFV